MPGMKNASALLPGVRLTSVNQRDQNYVAISGHNDKINL